MFSNMRHSGALVGALGADAPFRGGNSLVLSDCDETIGSSLFSVE
jgi:hypothetical protein